MDRMNYTFDDAELILDKVHSIKAELTGIYNKFPAELRTLFDSNGLSSDSAYYDAYHRRHISSNGQEVSYLSRKIIAGLNKLELLQEDLDKAREYLTALGL